MNQERSCCSGASTPTGESKGGCCGGAASAGSTAANTAANAAANGAANGAANAAANGAATSVPASSAGSCCSPGGVRGPEASSVQEQAATADELRARVQSSYGKIAQAGDSCRGPASTCCGATAEDFAKVIGYSAEELADTPAEANMALSCGNPSAVAGLQPGEVVLDLGSGGGFDAFICARKVGGEGRVIGVDMTPDMLALARKNARVFTERTGLANVEFRLGEIEYLPVADNTVDVIISNCVLNLSPRKAQVWREMARVLKPGGRVAISDLALRKPLPEGMKDDLAALVGCVAGAVLVEETAGYVAAAGLSAASLATDNGYIDKMAEVNAPLYRAIVKQLPAGERLSDTVTTLSVTATKPAPCRRG